jgi:hypothetical protein
MPSCNECPAVYEAIPATTCPNSYNDVVSLAIQRNGNIFLDASNDIRLLASWNVFIAASDDTQLVPTIRCNGFNAAAGTLERDGDRTNTPGGVGLNTGQINIEWNTSFTALEPLQFRAIENNFECVVNQGIYLIAKNSVGCKVHYDTDGVTILGYKPIPINDFQSGITTPEVANGGVERSFLYGVFDDEKWSKDVVFIPFTDFTFRDILPS